MDDRLNSLARAATQAPAGGLVAQSPFWIFFFRSSIEGLAGQRVVAVSEAHYCSLAVTADGTVWSWGRGAEGQLGRGDEYDQLLPKKVEALGEQRGVAVSAGAHHSIALTAVGAVFTCGARAKRKCCQRCQAVGHCQALCGVCCQAVRPGLSP